MKSAVLNAVREHTAIKGALLTPPRAVREAARRGLELYAAGYGGKGLMPETIRWARRIARGESLTPEKAINGRAWHARHYVDRRPGWQNPPTPGYVAYLLWFGEPGRKWFNKIVRGLR
jgi:hypothetical protein